jgi:uncharacterized phage protein (TIGR01671 family)
MNREIKFREKNKDIGWVEGQVAYDLNEDTYIIREVEQDSSYGLEEAMLFAIMWYRVDKETIGQYTGLKDENGKEIYRGDIVQGLFADQEESEIKGQVIYSKGQASYIVIASNNDEWELGYLDNLEVIGNIYDNPELLGGE